MGKDSHFTGHPVYSQVLKLLDKDEILQISRETNGSEAYVKRFAMKFFKSAVKQMAARLM